MLTIIGIASASECDSSFQNILFRKIEITICPKYKIIVITRLICELFSKL
ncbi:hypothetical protein [Flavobacterium sp. H122]|nr:hypothetical protein [Flavobacterium sp. H122]